MIRNGIFSFSRFNEIKSIQKATARKKKRPLTKKQDEINEWCNMIWNGSAIGIIARYMKKDIIGSTLSQRLLIIGIITVRNFQSSAIFHSNANFLVK